MIIGGAAQSRYNSNHCGKRQVVADCCSVCHKSREPRASGRVRETAMRTGRDRAAVRSANRRRQVMSQEASTAMARNDTCNMVPGLLLQ